MKAIRLFDSVINYGSGWSGHVGSTPTLHTIINNQTMKKILAIFLLTISISSFSQQIWQRQMPDSITVGVYLAYTEGASNSIPVNWIGVTSTDICEYNSEAGMELCKVAFVTRGPLPIPIEAQKWSGYWRSFYDTIPAIITTGIAETPITKPKVFITGDQLQLESSGTFLAEVFDIYGRLLTTVRSVDRATIDLTFQPVGIYIVRVNNSTFKILKQ